MAQTCLVMAGGRGERFGDPCKFMEEVCGERIILRLLSQLREVCPWVVVALSPYTISCAREVCEEVLCVALPGLGYVEDLTLILPALKKPTLVVAADLVVAGRALLDFINLSSRLTGEGVSVVTAVVPGDRGEEPVGLALFLDNGGRWADVALSEDLKDVDTREDLRAVSRACESFQG